MFWWLNPRRKATRPRDPSNVSSPREDYKDLTEDIVNSPNCNRDNLPSVHVGRSNEPDPQPPLLQPPTTDTVPTGKVNVANKPQLPSNPSKSTNDPTAEDAEFLRGIGREAQVWATYVKEANEHDDDMVDGWNRSLDVTLVFAALFSAILTAFVLESAKQLESDPAKQTVAILLEISRKLDTGNQAPNMDQTSSEAESDFKPSSNAIWVNCLWFLSLSLSIAVSLVAMLAKQWCFYYLSSRTGDTITQAEERQRRFGGLSKWRMRGILEHLPMLMHIALALFSVGLILYLWDINVAVASTVSAVSVSALCCYLGTIILPVWDLYCPYKTTQGVYTRKLLDHLAHRFPLLRKFLAPFLKQLPKAPGAETQICQSHPANVVSSRMHSLHAAWTAMASVFRTQLTTRSYETENHEPVQSSGGGPYHIDNATLPLHTIDMSQETTGTQESQDSDPDDETRFFVKDALGWLIFNSQKLSSIDTAIGALAIGRVQFENSNLKHQINLHLIKHFSDCFTSDRKDPKLRLHQNAMKSALDYVNWMTYFAESTFSDIEAQLLKFNESFDTELVIRLGLSFSCLAEQKPPSQDAGRNVALWLSAFVRCYNKGVLYIHEDVLSILVDGLTFAGQNIPAMPLQDRATFLAIPHLIDTLWRVSHIEKSLLRSSIGLNLVVFALMAINPYSIDNKDFEVAADHLAYNYRASDDRDKSFVSFVIFALIGFVHPESGIGLEKGILETATKIILETDYLSQPNIPIQIPKLESHTLRRHVTLVLVESMLNTPSNQQTPRRYLLDTAYVMGGAEVSLETKSVSDVCAQPIIKEMHKLIVSHFDSTGTLQLHDDAIVAATDLLYREVKKLKGLDTEIIGFEASMAAQISASELGSGSLPGIHSLNINSPDAGSSNASSQGRVTSQGDATKEMESLASSALALIMKKSDNKRCLETAVNAVLFHTNRCGVNLVMQATKWLAKDFKAAQPSKTKTEEDWLLHLCGYVRILVAMAMRCPDAHGLSKRLYSSDDSSSNDNLAGSIEKIIQTLTEAHDLHVRAFGVACHSAWKYACPNKTYGKDITATPLKTIWGLIADHIENIQANPAALDLTHDQSVYILRPEAVEALIDTTALFASVTEPKCLISHLEIQSLLRLLGQYGLDTKDPVRLSLAVALAFWGLSLNVDDWDFWPLEERGKYWRQYIHQEERDRDVAALFLLGLSRILAHCEQLKLNHASITTIAIEINHYMRLHAEHPNTLSLPFLSGYDVRRHVRESVRSYLQKTEEDGPFTKSIVTSRDKLRAALLYDGGEGFVYEEPQPFRKRLGQLSILSELEHQPAEK